MCHHLRKDSLISKDYLRKRSFTNEELRIKANCQTLNMNDSFANDESSSKQDSFINEDRRIIQNIQRFICEWQIIMWTRFLHKRTLKNHYIKDSFANESTNVNNFVRKRGQKIMGINSKVIIHQVIIHTNEVS